MTIRKDKLPETGREDLEIHLLLEAIYRHYGYDFRDYASSSLKRRILNFLRQEKIRTVSGLQERVLHEQEIMHRLLFSLSVNVTAMFRDPPFFQSFRRQVAPSLKTYPFSRIWCAGCSSGEEVYSLAILLHEEGLLEKCRIYATDMNEAVIEKARQGIFHLSLMQEFTSNYIRAGGQRPFSDYYTAAYDNAVFLPELKKNILFAQHNLVTDASFNEFQVILCRNVLIYFNKSLQDRVHKLLYESLDAQGFLVLGDKETIRFSPHEKEYESLDSNWKIFRRKR